MLTIIERSFHNSQQLSKRLTKLGISNNVCFEGVECYPEDKEELETLIDICEDTEREYYIADDCDYR